MKKDYPVTQSVKNNKSNHRKVFDFLLKAGALFIILEPIWMLLPFAGFLYGSVLHMEFLNRNPYTSWLVHFVFPTHTLFPIGIILIVTGFLIFLIGAFQIYTAKIMKKGLVKTGVYRKFRHPQYVSLTLFGVGILLTWGRFITYIAFFIMMWLYYFLSKKEEKTCLALFGNEYEEYRKKTWVLFPGEKYISLFFKKFEPSFLPKWVNVTGSFILILGLSLSTGLLIQEFKTKTEDQVPVIEGHLGLSENGVRNVRLIMVKGPAMQAAPSDKARNRFMAKAFESLTGSNKINQAVRQTGLDDEHVLIAFLNPGSNWYTGAHHDQDLGRFDLFMVAIKDPDKTHSENWFKQLDNIEIVKSYQAKDLSYIRLEQGLDPLEGEVRLIGPAISRSNSEFEKRMRERMKFFISGL